MATDGEHVIERLRSGVVPLRSLETFAVGVEKNRAEIGRQLDLAKSGEGAFKFLRGGYGCGKTFMCRLSLLDAHSRNFAGSFVVVSENDLQFHKFDEVYRRIMQELSTAYCERQALGDILDRWIGKIEEDLLKLGLDDSDPEFDEKVMDRLKNDLEKRTAGKVPPDMVRVITEIFRLKQQRRNQEAAALLSWLSGSCNVDASIKRLANIKGDIGSKNALDYLHGILEIIKAAGYNGLLVIIDEAETILRAKKDVRGKTLNGIRQIIDASDRFKGLLWIFTGTPDFFDNSRGVAGLQPLHDRIRFQKSGSFVNLRQPQLELKPFDSDRLKAVALRLRALFPTTDREWLEEKVSEKVIASLVERATKKFGGDVGVVPRQFLREFIGIMDLVEQPAEKDDDESQRYDPTRDENLEIAPDYPLDTVEELRLASGQGEFDPEPEDAIGYELINF